MAAFTSLHVFQFSVVSVNRSASLLPINSITTHFQFQVSPSSIFLLMNQCEFRLVCFISYFVSALCLSCLNSRLLVPPSVLAMAGNIAANMEKAGEARRTQPDASTVLAEFRNLLALVIQKLMLSRSSLFLGFSFMLVVTLPTTMGTA